MCILTVSYCSFRKKGLTFATLYFFVKKGVLCNIRYTKLVIFIDEQTFVFDISESLSHIHQCAITSHRSKDLTLKLIAITISVMAKRIETYTHSGFSS